MDDHVPLVCFEEDLARVLRCKPRTIQRLKRARRLPDPLPIPGRPRWSRDTVMAWLGVGAPKSSRRAR